MNNIKEGRTATPRCSPWPGLQTTCLQVGSRRLSVFKAFKDFLGHEKYQGRKNSYTKVLAMARAADNMSTGRK